MTSKKKPEQLTLWSGEVLANHSVSQESDSDSKTQEETLCLSIAELLEPFVRSGSSGKMFRVPCQVEKDRTSIACSKKWLNSGILLRGECLTLNSSESPKEDVDSSLSDVLETTSVHSKYYLSEKAAIGILRRAQKRGKTIPPKLKTALENMVTTDKTDKTE